MARTRTRTFVSEELPNVMVFGTRTFDDYPLLRTKLDTYTANLGRIIVVTGEWRGIGYGTPNYIGADLLAEQWASERKFVFRRFPPPFEDFPHNRKAALHVRNREMVAYMASLPPGDAFAVGFWDEVSPGTKSVIELLQKTAVPFKLVRYKLYGGTDG